MKEMSRRIRQVGFCLGLGVLVSLTGCVSTPGREVGECHLSLTSVGTVVMNGAVIRRGDLSRALKASGARHATPIVVSTEDTTPMSAISALTSQLATAGYRCVVFKRPRHVETQIGLVPAH